MSEQNVFVTLFSVKSVGCVDKLSISVAQTKESNTVLGAVVVSDGFPVDVKHFNVFLVFP